MRLPENRLSWPMRWYWRYLEILSNISCAGIPMRGHHWRDACLMAEIKTRNRAESGDIEDRSPELVPAS